MLNYEFDKENGILFLKPNGKLEKSDFEKLAKEIDPYIEKEGKLEGLLIRANTFPYWKDFQSMVTHFKFLRDHQKNF